VCIGSFSWNWKRKIHKNYRINCNSLALSYSLNLGQILFISLYSIFLKVWLFLHLKKKWNSSSTSFKSQNLHILFSFLIYEELFFDKLKSTKENNKIYIYSKIKTEYEMNNNILNINYEDRKLLCKMQCYRLFNEWYCKRHNLWWWQLYTHKPLKKCASYRF
jgi:hypothetical protein